MADGANRGSASADFLSASRADLTWLETVEPDDNADGADDDVAALRCEEWNAKAELERVLYEHAYRSCEAVELLRASWCSKRDFRLSRAAVDIEYASSARRFCAVTAELQ
jgi:hypothetical protein